MLHARTFLCFLLLLLSFPDEDERLLLPLLRLRLRSPPDELLLQTRLLHLGFCLGGSSPWCVWQLPLRS